MGQSVLDGEKGPHVHVQRSTRIRLGYSFDATPNIKHIVVVSRSWDKVYVVAKEGRMYMYKDHKSYKAAPEQCFRGEAPLDLNGAVVEVAANYTKKKHVFRLR